MAKKVTIELTEAQARIVLVAVEEWFRLRMGQSSDLANGLAMLGFNYKEHSREEFDERMRKRDALQAVIDAMLRIAFPWRGYIEDRKIEPEVHIASDIWSQLRWSLRGSVNYMSTPIQLGTEPMPKITVEEET